MSLKKQAISGALWTYGQQFGTQFIQFFVSVILARLILPEEFGLIGMLTIFIGLATVLINGGFTSSLIRSKEVSSIDYSTVFIFNLAACVVIYLILYACAPLIAAFYGQPVLTPLARLYGLNFVVAALGTVQNTILTRELRFKKLFLLGIPALVAGSAVGISMAYSGWGVWSLVGSYLVNTTVTTILLWVTASWKPDLRFSKACFKKHFNYGYKLTISGVLDTVFSNLYQIVIGRFYTAAQVGYYTRAQTLMMLPVGNIATALKKVTFPLFAKVQDEPERLKSAYRQVMIMVLFFCTPVVTFMAVLGRPLFLFLFGEKWLPAVPILQVIFIAGVLYPLHSYNLVILQVKGRSDLFLKLEVIKKLIVTVLLIVSFKFGFYGLFYAQVSGSVLALFINSYYSGKMINYPVLQQLRDCVPVFLFTAIAGAAAWGLAQLLPDQGALLQLATAALGGAMIYLTLALVFKFQAIQIIKDLILKK